MHKKIDFDNITIDDVISDEKEKIEWHKTNISLFESVDALVDNDKHRKYVKYHQQVINWLEELKERRNKDGKQTEA